MTDNERVATRLEASRSGDVETALSLMTDEARDANLMTTQAQQP
jgi:hypothetical protein